MPKDIIAIAPEFKEEFEQATQGRTPSSYVVPSVIVENDEGQKISQDVFSRLLAANIIMVDGPVRHEMAQSITAQIIHKIGELKDQPNAKITLQVNSPGGVVTEGLQIVDAMIKAQEAGIIVETVCTGMAASMGSVILVAGTPGHRHVWPNAEVMLHQASGGSQGTVKDAEIQAKELKYINARLQAFYRASHTKITEEQMKEIFDRDSWMRGEEALARGIVDHVDYPKNNPLLKEMLQQENFRHWHGNEELLRQRHISPSWKPGNEPLGPPEPAI